MSIFFGVAGVPLKLIFPVIEPSSPLDVYAGLLAVSPPVSVFLLPSCLQLVAIKRAPIAISTEVTNALFIIALSPYLSRLSTLSSRGATSESQDKDPGLGELVCDDLSK